MSRYTSTLITDREGEYLDTMIRTGLYGEDLAEVVGGLIRAGLQRAIEIGAIDVVVDPLPDVKEAPAAPAVLDDEVPF